MFLTNVVLAYTCTCLCLVKYVAVIAEEAGASNSSNEEEDDVQQRIALIDIVFTNGKKRTCTGAIVHDNVVITAGHCLMGPKTGGPVTHPELTASFVVIGDKKKFETGYEQYLPIERVLMHPNKNQFISDIALIHTFASMTTDKIGAIMPLVSDLSSFQTDSNITILSWGRTMVGETVPEAEPEAQAEQNDYDCNPDLIGSKADEGRYLECTIQIRDFRGHVQYMSESTENQSGKRKSSPRHKHRNKKKTPKQYYIGSPYGTITLTQQENPKFTNTAEKAKHRSFPTAKTQSIYLSSGEKNTRIKKLPSEPQRHRFMKIHRDTVAPDTKKPGIYNEEVTFRRSQGIINTNIEPYKNITSGNPVIKNQNATANNTVIRSMQNKNINFRPRSMMRRHWRRQMGSKEGNKLTVENFKFITLSACKKIIDAQKPKIKFNASEIVCYNSENHYVTDDDSGAPAVYKGELVAITVGSLKIEGDNYVAIGMKLSHFCPWVAENLPAGGIALNCWNYQTEMPEIGVVTTLTKDTKIEIKEDNNKDVNEKEEEDKDKKKMIVKEEENPETEKEIEEVFIKDDEPYTTPESEVMATSERRSKKNHKKAKLSLYRDGLINI